MWHEISKKLEIFSRLIITDCKSFTVFIAKKRLLLKNIQFVTATILFPSVVWQFQVGNNLLTHEQKIDKKFHRYRCSVFPVQSAEKTSKTEQNQVNDCSPICCQKSYGRSQQPLPHVPSHAEIEDIKKFHRYHYSFFQFKAHKKRP